MKNNTNGKGSKQRPTNLNKYRDNYDYIFKKNKIEKSDEFSDDYTCSFTKQSDLMGEHDVVLDAIYKESLHGE